MGGGGAGLGDRGPAARATSAASAAPGPLRRADIRAARDDGPLARFAGALVRGQLVPLPPAVAGLTATVLLATLGLHDLAGLVLLTPVAAMLLAAPGSAHPHDGPLDWLTPLVIQAGQYVYLAALGFAKGVPGPLTFALISLVALRQLDVAYRARHPMPAGDPRGGIGWEGRMLVAGVGAMLGVATFCYLALAVYLIWLLSSGSLASWLAARVPSARCPAAQRGQQCPGVPPQRRRGGRLGSPRGGCISMLLLRQTPLLSGGPGQGWRSPVTIPRLWLAAIFAACALFAAGMGVFSTDSLHRLWGLFAAVAYVLAAGVVLAWKSSRSVDLALLLGIGGALIAPLTLLAEQGRWQPEVAVIARGARLLLQHGSPYESQAVITASHDPNIYNPYLPVMAIFGLPRALFGPGIITDPRIWFTLGFVAVFAAALAVAGARDVLRWTVLVTATPVIAFSLTVGGPTFRCWRCSASAWRCCGAARSRCWPGWCWASPRPRRRPRGPRCSSPRPCSWSGTAGARRSGSRWPRSRRRPSSSRRSRRSGRTPWWRTRFFSRSGWPRSSPRRSARCPGTCWRTPARLGHTIAVVLLCLAGLGVLVSLVVRPPRNVPSATWRLIIGLVLMFVLAPATRFGYFMYPLGLWAWLIVSQLGARRLLPSGRPDEDAPGGRLRRAA